MTVVLNQPYTTTDTTAEIVYKNKENIKQLSQIDTGITEQQADNKYAQKAFTYEKSETYSSNEIDNKFVLYETKQQAEQKYQQIVTKKDITANWQTRIWTTNDINKLVIISSNLGILLTGNIQNVKGNYKVIGINHTQNRTNTLHLSLSDKQFTENSIGGNPVTVVTTDLKPDISKVEIYE